MKKMMMKMMLNISYLVLDCCILLISAALDSARNSSRLSVLLDLCVSSTLIGKLRLLWYPPRLGCRLYPMYAVPLTVLVGIGDEEEEEVVGPPLVLLVEVRLCDGVGGFEYASLRPK